MKTKRLFSLLLCMVLVSTLLPVTSYAASAGDTFTAVNSDGETIKYSVLTNTSTVEVVADTTAYSGTVNIPSQVSDATSTYSVTSIGNFAFKDCTSLTGVSVPNSVTAIGDNAFWGCNSLTSVTIPDGVSVIGNAAFYGCAALTSVTIPDGVTIIAGSAFAYCSGLTSVTIPDGVTTIGTATFVDCSSLTNVTIPDSVKNIMMWAFSGCTSLAAVYFDGAQPTIDGSGAFPAGTTLYHNTSIPYADGTYTFTECPTNTVAVDPGITNGTVIPSTSNGIAGETISLRITPDTNYYLVSASYDDGTSTTTINGTSFIMRNDAITVTAVFATCTVTFDSNGGSSVSPATASAISGGTVTLPTTNPTRSNYAFVGWNTAADGSGTAFTAATIVTADITVYAMWTDTTALTVNTLTPNGTGNPISGDMVITFSETMNTTAAGAIYISDNGGATYGSALTGGSWSASDTVYTISYRRRGL